MSNLLTNQSVFSTMKLGDKMNKKEQIYEAAIKLFNQNGFDRTPTSQIAKEASVATGTLFHFFSTKEDLINSLYLRCKESMISKLLLHVDEEKTYKSKMHRIYLNFLDWGLGYTDEFLFFQQFSNSAYINDRTRDEGESKFSLLTHFLLEGIEKEIIINAPKDYLLTITSASMMANLNYFLQNRNLIDDKSFIESTFDYLWNSIKN